MSPTTRRYLGTLPLPLYFGGRRDARPNNKHARRAARLRAFSRGSGISAALCYRHARAGVVRPRGRRRAVSRAQSPARVVSRASTDAASRFGVGRARSTRSRPPRGASSRPPRRRLGVRRLGQPGARRRAFVVRSHPRGGDHGGRGGSAAGALPRVGRRHSGRHRPAPSPRGLAVDVLKRALLLLARLGRARPRGDARERARGRAPPDRAERAAAARGVSAHRAARGGLLRRRGRPRHRVRLGASAHVPPRRRHRRVFARPARAPEQGQLDDAPARAHRRRGDDGRGALRGDGRPPVRVRRLRDPRHPRRGQAHEVHLRRRRRGHLRESVRRVSDAGFSGGGGRVHRARRHLQALRPPHQGLGLLRGEAPRRAPRPRLHVRFGDARPVHPERVPRAPGHAPGGAARISPILRRVRLGPGRGEHPGAGATRRPRRHVEPLASPGRARRAGEKLPGELPAHAGVSVADAG